MISNTLVVLGILSIGISAQIENRSITMMALFGAGLLMGSLGVVIGN